MYRVTGADALQAVDDNALASLKAGERIVVNGLQRVRPGDPVTPNIVPMGGAVPAAAKG